MIANYHAHTTRCNHAVGTETEYVESAISRGLEIFGFSDHTPQYFPGGYCTMMRMHTYELLDYCATVRHLQKAYRNRLQIHLGLEVEYYPAIWETLLSHLRDAGVEYMILGQHWLGNELGEPGSSLPTEDAHLLQRYCRQVMDAMETGMLTYVAHPDLFHFIGDLKTYRRHARDLCHVAKETCTPLEINLLGVLSHRHYPNEAFWEVAAEEGCPAILGIDAHAPDQIVNTAPERAALELVHRFGLKLLHTVPLKSI